MSERPTPADAPRPPAAPREAAAAILLRDGPDGPQVLLVRRSEQARFMPGFWVFPGGRVEPGDGAGDARWRTAALREVWEEVGLDVPAPLVPFDRWITPAGMPMRFDTTFFLAPADPAAVATVDGREVVAARWDSPARLLEAGEAGLPLLTYPTQAQLRRLAAFATVAAALASCGPGLPPPTITTVRTIDGRPTMLVAGPDGVPRRFRAGPVSTNELAHGWRPVPPAGSAGEAPEPRDRS